MCLRMRKTAAERWKDVDVNNGVVDGEVLGGGWLLLLVRVLLSLLSEMERGR